MAANRGPLCDDGSLGAVHGCRGDFDLSLLTEHAFLSILPSSLFLVLAAARLAVIITQGYGRNDKKFSGTKGATRLQFYKLAVITCYIGLQISLLLLVVHRAGWPAYVTGTDVSTVAAVLGLCAALTLAPLSWVEHSSSSRPSTLISIYLLFSLLCDAIQTRTLWLQTFDTPAPNQRLALSTVASTALVVKAGLLLLESIEKPSLPLSKSGSLDERTLPGPEERAGVLSRSLLTWVRDILVKGKRTLLSPADLEPLRHGLGTSVLAKQFRSNWGSSRPGHVGDCGRDEISSSASNKTPNQRLALVLIRTLKWSFLAPIIPRISLLCFTFCQPLLLREFLRFFAGEPAFVPESAGYVFIILYGFIYTGLAVSAAIYWRLVYKALVQMRGCVVSAVHEMTVLQIDASQGDMDAPLSLVSTDMERIISGAKDMHEVWANTLQAALSLWLLYRELGLACVAPAAVAIASSLGSMLMSSKADKVQVSWMEATQERVGVMAKAVAGIRSVKFLGLSDTVYDALESLRMVELHAARHFRHIEVLTAVIAFMPLFLSPVFTFLVFVVQARSTGKHLDVVTAFVSLSLLHLMTQPLVWLFQAVPLLVASMGCINRVDKYLHSPSRQTPFEGEAEAALEGDAIIIRNGKLGWTRESEKPVLSNVNIHIPSRQLTLVVGPVASGKSTLAKALVGQLPHVSTDNHMNYHSRGGVAFCDQDPFLMNDSIRTNIVGFSSSELPDPNWLDTVVRAVGLDKDLATFSNGIETHVGSKVARLSGGQRHRVSIARALYSRKRLAVFDDVLSSLDAVTKQDVFSNVLGPRGLFRLMDCTVVLCTHEAAFLPRADHIIVLGGDGRVAGAGNFQHVRKTCSYVQSLVIGNGNGSTATGVLVHGEAPAPLYPLTWRNAEDEGREHGNDSGSTLFVQGPQLLTEQPPADDATRRLGDTSIYRYMVHHIGLWRTLVFVLLTCGSAVFSTIGPVWLKTWSSDHGNLATRSNHYYLGVYALFQALALLFLGLFAGFALTTLAVKIGKSLHQVLLHATMCAPPSFFHVTDMGTITNRFSGDMILIDGDLAMALLETLSSGLVATVQMIYIAVAGPYVAIAYPFLMLCLYYVQSFYLTTSRQLRLLDLEARSPLQSKLLETIHGLATIRAFAWGEPSVQKFQRTIDASQSPLYLLFMIQRWLQLVLELLIAATAVILVAVALHLRSTSQGFL